jgi:hypothetical protein
LTKLNIFKCLQCNSDVVPELIIATIDPPPGLKILGEPKNIEARICKGKKKERGEQNAQKVSEKVFFMEYDLHNQLIKKMRLFSMNAVFSLSVKITLGDHFIMGVARATAVRVLALPLPPTLSIHHNEKFKNSNPNNDEDYVKFFNDLEERSKFYAERAIREPIQKI